MTISNSKRDVVDTVGQLFINWQFWRVGTRLSGCCRRREVIVSRHSNLVSILYAEHKKIYSISDKQPAITSLLYEHTDEGVYGDILKISDHFLKISKNCPKPTRTLSNPFRKIPKNAEDVRRHSSKI